MDLLGFPCFLLCVFPPSCIFLRRFSYWMLTSLHIVYISRLWLAVCWRFFLDLMECSWWTWILRLRKYFFHCFSIEPFNIWSHCLIVFLIDPRVSINSGFLQEVLNYRDRRLWSSLHESIDSFIGESPTFKVRTNFLHFSRPLVF